MSRGVDPDPEADKSVVERVDARHYGDPEGYRPDVAPPDESDADGDESDDSDSDGDDAPGYTRHVEPPKQGGEPYWRCEDCGREILDCIGRERLVHADGCSNPDAESQYGR